MLSLNVSKAENKWMRLHVSQHAVRGGARDPPRDGQTGSAWMQELLLLEGPRISQMLYSDHLFHLEIKINGLHLPSLL